MKRRGRDRRRSPTTTCQRCGGTLRRIGQPGIGVQILKCPACGIMDRRLPVERRALPTELELRRFALEDRARRRRWVIAAAIVLVVVVVAWGAAVVLAPAFEW